jgi:hypothetical protein
LPPTKFAWFQHSDPNEFFSDLPLPLPLHIDVAWRKRKRNVADCSIPFMPDLDSQMSIAVGIQDGHPNDGKSFL